MKGGIRIAAITSGPAAKGESSLVVCVVMRDNIIEGVLSTSVKADGTDSTQKITAMIKRSRFCDQVKLIALNGIAIAGLNVIDIRRVTGPLNAGFAVLTRHRPRRQLLVKALERLSEQTGADTEERVGIIEEMAGLKFVRIGGFFIQSDAEVTENLARLAFEALRISHLIARGVATGESKGRI